MKRIATQICSLVVLVIALGAVSAYAQSATGYRAHIPFDFNVGKLSLPAGDYVIGVTEAASNQSVLKIRKADGRNEHYVMIMPKTTDWRADVSKLVFNRYENRYFLAEMITPTLGAEFQRVKGEAALAKQQKAQRESVAINVNK